MAVCYRLVFASWWVLELAVLVVVLPVSWFVLDTVCLCCGVACLMRFTCWTVGDLR